MDALEEALEMVETLAANLQLAHYERGELTNKEVDKAVRDAGKLLKKNGFKSDMAAP